MARLAAIAKSLYYPTQDRILSLLAENIDPTGEGSFLLDPCCGKGHALRFLAKAWNLTSVGVEIDPERFEEAQGLLDQSFLGSIHQVKCKGKVSAVLLNPPYDYGHEGRQEYEFLRITESFMEDNALLIYIVPLKSLDNSDITGFLRSKFRNLKVWKYPEPEFNEFRQIVILGQRKKPQAENSYYSRWYGGSWYSEWLPTSTDQGIPILGEDGSKYEVDLPKDQPEFSLHDLNPDAIAPERNEGVYQSAAWDLLVGDRESQTANPLMPPRTGHRAMMLVSGFLNGLEINGKLVKGRSIKSVRSLDKEDGTHIEREQIDSIISQLDLRKREFESWNAREDEEKTIGWFDENGSALSNAIETAYTPQWSGDLSLYDFSSFLAPGTLPGKTKPEFLEAQKQAAAAITHRWKTYKTVILCGEQGIGKTSIATIASGLSSLKKVVIICPSHLVPKWLRETKLIFQNQSISQTASKISEVEHFFSHSKQWERFLRGETEPKFLVLSKEKAKLGARWSPSAVIRSKKDVVQILEDGTRIEETIKIPFCPDCGKEVSEPEDFFAGKKKLVCENTECKSPLWTSEAISGKGTKRWALAHYISKHYSGQYGLILDETHAFAKAETDQGKAVQMLASGAEKILAMTGTLYGGRASSLFHLLYKIDPLFRQLYAYNEAQKFSEQHGLFEQVFKEEEQTSHYGYRRGRSGGRLKEIPGVSPTMINLLLHFTIFVKLQDLGIQLPPYSETVELLDPDPDVARNVQSLMDQIRGELRKHPSLIGSFLMASLGYPDAPENREEIWVNTEDSREFIASIPAVVKKSMPKDQRLLEIVQENKEEGRKVLVYFTQTQKRNPIPRVKAFLESHGLKVEHMPSSVAPTKREEWVQKAQQRGFDVMLTNGRLVETGLDLLFATTIIQYGIEYSINSLRQSIRRSWRLGQKYPIRVIFFAYRGTLQQEAMQLIAKKMKAAELLDGEDEFSGLSQHDDSSQDFLLELAQKAMKSM